MASRTVVVPDDRRTQGVVDRAVVSLSGCGDGTGSHVAVIRLNRPHDHELEEFAPMRCSLLLCVPVAFAVVLGVATRPANGKATAADALKLVPIQPDVEYDRPGEKEAADCDLSAEKRGGVSGWIVRGPAGQLLRRFLDTNGDNKVDQWCYYQNGVEVYRDIDADFDEKADQYRWMGTAGMRWGLDENEDGKIDTWKVISPEEVSSELIAALRDGDARRFALLLLSGSELQTLGVGETKQKELLPKLQSATKRFTEIARRQRMVGPQSKWLDFGASQPGVVPAGTEGLTRDIVLYDNAVATFESAGQAGQLIMGTLVRVGDAWRLLDLPAGLLGDQADAAPGVFYFASVSAVNDTAEELQTAGAEAEAASPEVQKLVADLDRLEQDITTARASSSAAKLEQLNDRRAAILEDLARRAKTDEERTVWLRQLADTVGAAVQSGAYPKGLKILAALYDRLDPKSDLAGYVKFRYMSAAYATSIQAPDADFAKIQEQWLQQLAEFVSAYPDTSDAVEAMLQLAIAEEFAGKEKDAHQWYEKIVQSSGGETLIGRKAQGALRRLESTGKPMNLKGRLTDGRTFDLASRVGRVVLIHYWATWCEPCKQDLRVLQELQAQYGKRGFALVGINLDNDPKLADDFLRRTRLPWPQMREPGGLDGRLATDLGVLTLPTMILIDEEGKVVNRNIHVTELEGELRKRLR